jgi:hypothetical protein
MASTDTPAPILTPGADFSYIFSGENFGENSAENFPPKNVGEMEFFQKIPQNFPRKFFLRKIGPRFILNRMLFLVGLKLQPLLLDSSLNGVDNVIANIFEAR